MNTIKIKNHQLDVLAKVLNYKMSFQKGRIRNRFMNILSEKHNAIEKSRAEILLELSDKLENGKPKIENNAYVLSEENKIKWNEEYPKLMNEDCIIDITPSLEADLPTIKVIINESTIELDSNETSIVEEILKTINGSKKA